MSRRLGHLGFNSALRVSVDHLIHGSDGWSRVFEVYSPWVGSEAPILERFHTIKKNKIIIILKSALD
jgi:hypothetical protein